MKKRICCLLLLILCVALLAFAAGCKANEGKDAFWKDAKYTEDTEIGSGSKTLIAEVTAGEKTVTFTVHTDETTVGYALQTAGILEGEEGPYGLYIKTVNGITADYDVDQSYWAFYVDGEYAMTGADLTEIAENTVYKFEYAK